MTSTTNITILLPAGRVPLDILQKAHELAEKHALGVYLSTLQNLRLTNVPETIVDEVKKSLSDLGAHFKAPGVFPIPRVCVGDPHCNLALIDTETLSAQILKRFSSSTFFKPKLKVSIAACPACCSGTKTSDIGIMANRNGFEMYIGGKGGISPTIGKRILRNASEQEVLEAIELLIDFHDNKTTKKLRMVKLLDDPALPFANML